MSKTFQIWKKLAYISILPIFFGSFFSINTQAISAPKITYRFSPNADKCYASGTKEYKKLYQNRIYKTLADCQKKLKNKSGQVLGAFEKKGGLSGGTSTSVSLVIKAK